MNAAAPPIADFVHAFYGDSLLYILCALRRRTRARDPARNVVERAISFRASYKKQEFSSGWFDVHTWATHRQISRSPEVLHGLVVRQLHGHLSYCSMFVDGVKHGEELFFGNDMVARHRLKVLVGNLEHFEGLRLLVRRQYANGLLHGITEEYDVRDGSVIRQTHFRRGRQLLDSAVASASSLARP